MLEGLSIPRYLKLSDNALGADNQQERPAEEDLCWNPQRLYARFQRNVCWKRYSPNCMATCREWQKCPLLFHRLSKTSEERPSAAKAETEGTSNGTTGSRALPKTI